MPGRGGEKDICSTTKKFSCVRFVRLHIRAENSTKKDPLQNLAGNEIYHVTVLFIKNIRLATASPFGEE